MKKHTYTSKKITDLYAYAMNSRTHSNEQINQIKSSIQEFGFTNPVLIDESGQIIAGHGRIEAAKGLGVDEVPCIILDGLTEAQKKAYVIADNQLALNAGWDLDTLKLEIESLSEMDFDVDLLGFDDDFFFNDDFESSSQDDQGQLDSLEPSYIDCPHCGKEFDMRGKI